MGLNDALRALERAAADVAALLPDDIPEAALLDLSAAWGPVPRGGGHKPKLADARAWIGWIRSCGSLRPEARRPVEPEPEPEPELTADEIHRVIVKWACDTSSGPAENPEIRPGQTPLLRTQGHDRG